MNLPLTGGFVAEFLVLLGLSNSNSFILIFLSLLGVLTNGIYCIWLFNRLCMGYKSLKINEMEYSDLDRREYLILLTLAFIIVFLGIFPNFFFKYLLVSTYLILLNHSLVI
jgi:NADH-quinone oxidoreductase subunit M